MSFRTKLKIGDIVTNNDISEEFKCGNMGGMRKSNTTKTLVIITDHTRGLYNDRWENDILQYTGMGKSGDQNIDWMQNKTLKESSHNNIEVHLPKNLL
jgi:5-methylcytosine-specific restriction protein A